MSRLVAVLLYFWIGTNIWGIFGKNYEILLYKHLLDDYDVLERPVLNASEAIEVFLGISLQQLIDIVKLNDIFNCN